MSAYWFFDVYQLGIVQNALAFLRVHHPLVLTIPLFVVFFILASAFAAFKGANKVGYGFCEFLTGTISALGLSLIAIHGEKPLTETELVVALCGSFYLATEGISLVAEDRDECRN